VNLLDLLLYSPPSDEFLQNLLANDWLQWIIAMYVSPLGQFFYLFVAILIWVPLYIRTQSLAIPMLVWLLLGGFFISLMPIIAPVAVVISVIGAAGLILSMIVKTK